MEDAAVDVVAVTTRPLSSDGDMAEDRGAAEAWQLAGAVDRRETNSRQRARVAEAGLC